MSPSPVKSKSNSGASTKYAVIPPTMGISLINGPKRSISCPRLGQTGGTVDLLSYMIVFQYRWLAYVDGCCMMSRGPSQLPGRNLNITFDSDISSEGTSHIIRKRWMSKFDVGFSQLLIFNIPIAYKCLWMSEHTCQVLPSYEGL